MGKYEKFLQRILGGRSDASISFSDLCHLILRFGFEERTSGSHHLFRKTGNEAKPYQVRQVRKIILKYQLGDEMNG